MADFQRINEQLDQSAKRIESMMDAWAINADAERRFHHRSDEDAIDEMLELIVLNSILFGDDEDEDSV